MPIEAQTRLLRVLQEGEYTTVGGNRTIKANVRIITATHRDLKLLIRQGLFREDLYYRLNVVPLRLPALRERKEDIPVLVDHFLQKGSKEMAVGRKVVGPEVMQLLTNYEWPGNIRELENTVKSLMITNVKGTITLDSLPKNLVEIIQFSITALLNNISDHSKATKLYFFTV